MSGSASTVAAHHHIDDGSGKLDIIDPTPFRLALIGRHGQHTSTGYLVAVLVGAKHFQGASKFA
ncbi:MAG: hypothetical protein MI861_15165 [Pirellulales bacterium]|nr:hypothetical protein [Pirellulales bacterium]